jgi:hypothetical protein
MGPRQRARQDILNWLDRAAEQAQRAEAYHAAAANPRALEERAARQAACDAAAMQLIELVGCAEGFVLDRGDAGTTLARFDNALRPLIKTRIAHAHPEWDVAVPPVTPRVLKGMIAPLDAALGNLDNETLRIQPPDQKEALNRLVVGLKRIVKEGLPDPEALRPRDLHYAGYYREILFGRLAKATGLFDTWGRFHGDPRYVEVSSRISIADDMAHKFHAMREGTDKCILPASVVVLDHRSRVPDRSLSEVVRKIRDDLQTPNERLIELDRAATARHRTAVEGLAEAYARITGDPKAAAVVREYVRQHEPRLEPQAIDAMREALEIAAAATGDYLAVPEAVRTRCVEMCLEFDRQDDSRLLEILDSAERRHVAGGQETIYERYPSLTCEVEDPEIGPDMDLDNERGPRRGR